MEMKKNPFYRRGGRDSPNAGLKERIAWQLSKRPMTGAELAAIFGMELRALRKFIRDLMYDSAVVEITASNEHIREGGAKDWLYSMERKAKRIAVKPKEKQQFVIIPSRAEFMRRAKYHEG